jgi:hypothetical protein
VVSEDHSYKSEAYYTSLRQEMEGSAIAPSSTQCLEAYVVPICLERAKLAGVEVADWEISYSYAEPPCLVYGLNYFSDPSDHVHATDDRYAKAAVRHFTNKGKYPFCCQKLGPDDKVREVVAVFGHAVTDDQRLADMASRLHEIFGIPLMRFVVIDGTHLLLSSVCPVSYSSLTKEEADLLSRHIRSSPAEGDGR